MHPIETSYTLATTSKDYRDCHRLVQAEDKEQDPGKFSFPTVMAKRDGEVIGFLGTLPSNHYVMAGPLVIKGGRNAIIALRLVEAYDMIMSLHGIKLYYFSTDAKRIDSMARTKLEALGMQFWEEKDGLAWYKRKLQ